MTSLAAHGVLVGAWRTEMRMSHLDVVHGTTTFEWMPGEQFLVQRAETEDPVFPRGIMLIGAGNDDRDDCVQHYFDSRGVTRTYASRVSDDGVWTLWRDEQPEFLQRFKGRIEGDTITAAWEKSVDQGPWQHDFDLIYRRA